MRAVDSHSPYYAIIRGFFRRHRSARVCQFLTKVFRRFEVESYLRNLHTVATQETPQIDTFLLRRFVKTLASTAMVTTIRVRVDCAPQ